MTQRKQQMKLVFQIGYDRNENAMFNGFERQIIKAASMVSGGCTTRTNDGWWMSDGAEHKAEFTGKLQRETCFELELTCEMHKAEDAYHSMVYEIAVAADTYGVNTDWVHVTETPMTGRHFSVKETLASITPLVTA